AQSTTSLVNIDSTGGASGAKPSQACGRRGKAPCCRGPKPRAAPSTAAGAEERGEIQ
ncbi:unnamed protein product, partial [Effrenium voratum]